MGLTYEQADKFCHTAMKVKTTRAHRVAIMCRFLLTTGLREKEFRNLRINQCRPHSDGKHVQIRVENLQTGNRRHVFVPVTLFESARLMFNRNDHGSPYLFTSEPRGGSISMGRRMDKSNLAKRLKHFGETLSFENITPGSLRKACIEGMLKNPQLSTQTIAKYTGLKHRKVQALRSKISLDTLTADQQQATEPTKSLITTTATARLPLRVHQIRPAFQLQQPA